MIEPPRRTWLDAVVALILFCATATVVIWQNSRITVLYDLSGVLEPAWRMSLGDRPYLDFPFPYAPLTFLIQASIIRSFGTVYWHHIAYAAIIAATATFFAWRIVTSILRDTFPDARLISLLLAVPLIPLGIYCIFPHPFYDPDAAFCILFLILILLRNERHGFPVFQSLITGMLLVIPLFIKQNIGLTFLVGIAFGLLLILVIDAYNKRPVAGLLATFGGIGIGIFAAATVIHYWVGLDNYKYWTWTFATGRRAPAMSDMLTVYQDQLLLLWLALVGFGIFLLWLNKGKMMAAIGVVLISVPFAWPAVYLLLDTDSSERAERLVNLWPVVLASSLIMSLVCIRTTSGIKRVLPFILFCTVHGVFLSQQLWGSTYGIWPLFIILTALMLYSINELTERAFGRLLTGLAAVIAVSLTIAGSYYVYSNERLDYVDFEDGDMAQSTVPQLKGLSIRGSYLPDFEELVRYTNENIPPEDGILAIPGEDLFYYTTGRHPKFPALLFDVTNNPYSPDQIAELARERDIKWLIVKEDLQIEADQMIDDKKRIFEVLKPEFKQVESLNNYDIYRRKLPGETDDEDEDDSNDDGNDDSDDSGN